MKNETILKWLKEAVAAYEDNLGMYTGTPYERAYLTSIAKINKAYKECGEKLKELEEKSKGLEKLYETYSIR